MVFIRYQGTDNGYGLIFCCENPLTKEQATHTGDQNEHLAPIHVLMARLRS